MNKVVYKTKTFDIILTPEKMLVRTSLQAFLLYPKNTKSNRLNIAREVVESGQVKCWDDFMRLLYNDDDEIAIDLLPVSRSYCD